MLATDDRLATVDNVYLGPPGWDFPWRARFVAYLIAVVAFVVGLGVCRRLGVPMSIWAVVWLLLGAVAFTREVGKRVNYETPLRALAATLAHEVCGPRPPAAVAGTALPGRVKVAAAAGPRLPRERRTTGTPPDVIAQPAEPPTMTGACFAWLCDACRATAANCSCPHHRENAHG